jgi:hypothetical protein
MKLDHEIREKGLIGDLADKSEIFSCSEEFGPSGGVETPMEEYKTR